MTPPSRPRGKFSCRMAALATLLAATAFGSEAAAAVPGEMTAALAPSAPIVAGDGEIAARLQASTMQIAGEPVHAALLRRFYELHGFAPVWPSRQGAVSGDRRRRRLAAACRRLAGRGRAAAARGRGLHRSARVSTRAWRPGGRKTERRDAERAECRCRRAGAADRGQSRAAALAAA